MKDSDEAIHTECSCPFRQCDDTGACIQLAKINNMPRQFIVDNKVHAFDLSPFEKYLGWNDGMRYFNMPAGENHHKLLAYLSSQLPDGSEVIDMGTLIGASAVALATNSKIKVRTFDVTDYAQGRPNTYKSLPNIEFVNANALHFVSTMMGAEIIFCDVSPHDGAQERKLIDELTRMQYKGLLILDDTEQFLGLKAVWNSLEHKRLDLTAYGHHSGTGAVMFDGGSTIEIR